MVGWTKSFTLMKIQTLCHTDYSRSILPSLCSPFSSPHDPPLLRYLSIPGRLWWLWRTQHPIHTIFIMVKPFRDPSCLWMSSGHKSFITVKQQVNLNKCNNSPSPLWKHVHLLCYSTFILFSATGMCTGRWQQRWENSVMTPSGQVRHGDVWSIRRDQVTTNSEAD